MVASDLEKDFVMIYIYKPPSHEFSIWLTELDISYESTCYRKQDNRVAEEEEVEVIGVRCYLII